MNPKDEAGSRKAPLQYVPPALVIEASKALEQGAMKYGPYNWRTGPRITLSLYLAAIERHLLAFQDGEDNAPDSGISHIGHIAATCGVILDALACGNLLDDRIKGPGATLLEQMNHNAPKADWDRNGEFAIAKEAFRTGNRDALLDIALGDVEARATKAVSLRRSKIPPPEDVLPLVSSSSEDKILTTPYEEF